MRSRPTRSRSRRRRGAARRGSARRAAQGQAREPLAAPHRAVQQQRRERDPADHGGRRRPPDPVGPRSVRSRNGPPRASARGDDGSAGRPATGAPPATRSGIAGVVERTMRAADGSKYENASDGISSVPAVCGTTTYSQVREPVMPVALVWKSLFTCGGYTLAPFTVTSGPRSTHLRLPPPSTRKRSVAASPSPRSLRSTVAVAWNRPTAPLKPARRESASPPRSRASSRARPPAPHRRTTAPTRRPSASQAAA